MCTLLHTTDLEGGDHRYFVDGLPVPADVFEAYRRAGRDCFQTTCDGRRWHHRSEARSTATRQRIELAARAPKRADAGRHIVPQHDASGLALFQHANEPTLF